MRKDKLHKYNFNEFGKERNTTNRIKRNKEAPGEAFETGFLSVADASETTDDSKEI